MKKLFVTLVSLVSLSSFANCDFHGFELDEGNIINARSANIQRILICLDGGVHSTESLVASVKTNSCIHASKPERPGVINGPYICPESQSGWVTRAEYGEKRSKKLFEKYRFIEKYLELLQDTQIIDSKGKLIDGYDENALADIVSDVKAHFQGGELKGHRVLNSSREQRELSRINVEASTHRSKSFSK